MITSLTSEALAWAMLVGPFSNPLPILTVPQIDPLRPTKYPLEPDNPLSSQRYNTDPQAVVSTIPVTPKIKIVKSWRKLSVHAAELYLGAETKDQELSIFVSWDGNVFEDKLVEEWLEEIRSATEYYLC